MGREREKRRGGVKGKGVRRKEGSRSGEVSPPQQFQKSAPIVELESIDSCMHSSNTFSLLHAYHIITATQVKILIRPAALKSLSQTALAVAGNSQS